jgi:RNA polymerase sigma-70 factor (ECF subfamily)
MPTDSPALLLSDHLRTAWDRARAVLPPERASVADAEDWAQEALLLAWQRGLFVGDQQAALAFVRRVVVTKGREATARQREAPAGLLRRGPAFPGPEEVLLSASARGLVQRCLARLKRRHRSAILLFELEGLTATQAARLLGIPLHTFYSRLRNGRALLAAIVRRRQKVSGPQ